MAIPLGALGRLLGRDAAAEGAAAEEGAVAGGLGSKMSGAFATFRTQMVTFTERMVDQMGGSGWLKGTESECGAINKVAQEERNSPGGWTTERELDAERKETQRLKVGSLSQRTKNQAATLSKRNLTKEELAEDVQKISTRVSDTVEEEVRAYARKGNLDPKEFEQEIERIDNKHGLKGTLVEAFKPVFNPEAAPVAGRPVGGGWRTDAPKAAPPVGGPRAAGGGPPPPSAETLAAQNARRTAAEELPTLPRHVARVLKGQKGPIDARAMHRIMEAAKRDDISAHEFADQIINKEGPIGTRFAVGGTNGGGKYDLNAHAMNAMNERVGAQSLEEIRKGAYTPAELKSHYARIDNLADLALGPPPMSGTHPDSPLGTLASARALVDGDGRISGKMIADLPADHPQRLAYEEFPEAVRRKGITPDQLATRVQRNRIEREHFEDATMACRGQPELYPGEISSLPEGSLRRAAEDLHKNGKPLTPEALSRRAAQLDEPLIHDEIVNVRNPGISSTGRMWDSANAAHPKIDAALEKQGLKPPDQIDAPTMRELMASQGLTAEEIADHLAVAGPTSKLGSMMTKSAAWHVQSSLPTRPPRTATEAAIRQKRDDGLRALYDEVPVQNNWGTARHFASQEQTDQLAGVQQPSMRHNMLMSAMMSLPMLMNGMNPLMMMDPMLMGGGMMPGMMGGMMPGMMGGMMPFMPMGGMMGGMGGMGGKLMLGMGVASMLPMLGGLFGGFGGGGFGGFGGGGFGFGGFGMSDVAGELTAMGAGALPTGNVSFDLSRSIANAPPFSPTEMAMLSQIKDPQQRSIQMLQMYMQKQALLATVITNLAQMRHDMMKATAQNLRS
jgi:hypothetical protein